MDSDSSPSAAPPAAAEAGRYTYSPRLRWHPEVEEYFAAAYGRDHFARISEALAHPSCYSCIRVNTLKSSTDAIMHKLMDLISKNELSAVINGLEVVELNGGEQQHERGSLVHKCPYAGLENVLFVQGSGPHVLHYGSQPDQAVKEVVVSRKCAESVLRGAQFPKVGGPGIVGSCELFNKSYTEEWLREDEAELVQRFDPSSSVDTIGFFIAKFNVGEKDE